jgi:sugar lactone lactonase YvrE
MEDAILVLDMLKIISTNSFIFSLLLGFSVQAATLQEAVNLGNRQVTGVAVSKEGRLFVCFPRWDEFKDLSVAEVLPDGQLQAFPLGWDQMGTSGSLEKKMPEEGRLVCIQSVFVDDKNDLWILDSGAPNMGPLVSQPRLLQVDLRTNRVKKVFGFDAGAAPAGSYLNDVRIDTVRKFAYLTDSGLGALVVANLNTGTAYRVLTTHLSTKAEPDFILKVFGRALVGPDNQPPRIHSDGLELSGDRNFLYYHALTGNTLYRIETAVLRDEKMSDEKRAEVIQKVAKTPPTDGLAIDAKGSIYLTGLEDGSIRRITPEGPEEMVVTDERLSWPDSIAISPTGAIYVSASQIQNSARFNKGTSVRTKPYIVYKVVP